MPNSNASPSFIRRIAMAIALACVAGVLPSGVAHAITDQGVVDCTASHLAKHNPNLAGNPDRVICFEAYVSNFDTQPRTIKNKKHYVGVPHWVAHHVARAASSPEKKDRPDNWFTIPDLATQKIAPTDESYQFSKQFRATHKNWYERGHLAQKYLAERLGGTAGWFTHNVVNAVPQLSKFNKGPWLTLECYAGAWANKYGEVWVVAGPVFAKSKPIRWLRSNSNKTAMPVAIPIGIFKIVLKKSSGDQWDVLGFIYPQNHKTYAKGPYDPGIWLKSVKEIERQTGLDLLAGVANATPAKDQEATKLWPVAESDFDSGCDGQAATVP